MQKFVAVTIHREIYKLFFFSMK